MRPCNRRAHPSPQPSVKQRTICSSSEYWWRVPVQHSTRLWRTGQSLIISGWLSCCWRGEECNMIAVFMVRSRYLLLLLLIGEYFKTLKNQHPDFSREGGTILMAPCRAVWVHTATVLPKLVWHSQYTTARQERPWQLHLRLPLPALCPRGAGGGADPSARAVAMLLPGPAFQLHGWAGGCQGSPSAQGGQSGWLVSRTANSNGRSTQQLEVRLLLLPILIPQNLAVQ